MNTTRKQVKADLFEAVSTDDKALADTLFTRLVFWGANAYEYRGVSDARLTHDELAMVAPALVGSTWFESIFNLLCE